MTNSEEQAERAGFNSLTQDQATRIEENQKAAERKVRIQENGEEMMDELRRAAESFEDIARCARMLRHPVMGEAADIPARSIRQLLAKIEGQP